MFAEWNCPVGYEASISIAKVYFRASTFFLSTYYCMYLCQYWCGIIIVFTPVNINDKMFLQHTPLECLKHNNMRL